MNLEANRRWWAMAATALTLFVVGLDMTVLNVALPDIAVSLRASTAQLQWFADAYLLVLAAVMLPAGMAGDRFGRKRLTLAGLAIFGVGSLWCAYAAGPGSLVAARAFLGLGAALLIPLAMSAVVVLFEPSERARAVLVLGLATMVGLPLGPIVAGVLLEHFWWGSVFVINVPVVAFALLAVAVFMPADRGAATRLGLDYPGVVASAVGLLGLTYGVIEAPSRGYGDPLVLGSLVGGIVVLLGFLWWERRLVGLSPVFDFAVWSDRAFRWGVVAATVASLAFFGVMFTLPQYFRAVLGADALGTGLRMLPMVLGMLVGMRGAGMLVARVPSRLLAAGGFLLVSVALAFGATTSVTDTFLRTALWTTCVGLGFGVALFTAQNVALTSLPRDRAATGSALAQTLRQVGSVLGIAVLGALLNDRYRAGVDASGIPANLAARVRDSAQSGIEVARASGSATLARSVSAAFIQGMDVALAVSAVVALAGAALVLLRLPVGGGVASDAAESERAADVRERTDARAA